MSSGDDLPLPTFSRMLEPMFGMLNVNKPTGPTSHDIVAMVRRMLPRKTKVGHAGTLDPFASGVLVVCVGPATRLAQYVQAQPKRYLAEITLGATSTTDDCKGEITPSDEACEAPSTDRIQRVLDNFVGEIEQIPPAHSAVHVNGRRAYKLARAGKQLDLPPRPVTVYGIELVSFDFPRLQLDVRCGTGTYIRAMARDIGQALGVGGYCSALTRTEVGGFRIAEAKSPNELLPERDIVDPLEALGDLPKLVVDEAQAYRLANGNQVTPLGSAPAGTVAVVSEDGRVLALGRFDPDSSLVTPEKVFPQS